MSATLAETLDAVHDRLDARATSPDALARARALLATLPARLSDWIYLELPLWPRRPRVDLIIRVDRAHREALAALADQRAAHARWARVGAFAQAWQRESWPSAAAVDSLWLEFDLDAGADGPHSRLPRFFVDLTREARLTGDAARWARIADEALAPLLARPLDSGVRALLRRCLDALPPGASLLSLGVPHDDGGGALRVCVIGIGDDQLHRYLQAAGWCGNWPALRARLEPLCRATGRRQSVAILDLDLDARGPGTLGLEIGFARCPQLRGIVAEAEVFTALLDHQLADAEMLAALRRWPGRTLTRLPGRVATSLIVRRLNHVKLVVESNRLTAVKAYPCFFSR